MYKTAVTRISQIARREQGAAGANQNPSVLDHFAPQAMLTDRAGLVQRASYDY